MNTQNNDGIVNGEVITNKDWLKMIFDLFEVSDIIKIQKFHSMSDLALNIILSVKNEKKHQYFKISFPYKFLGENKIKTNL